MTPPGTHRGRADWIRQVDARTVRRRCGISTAVLGAALGVSRMQVTNWEAGRTMPIGARGAAYARIIAGLMRHLEVPDG